MATRRCSECGNRSREGFASTYLAWYPEPNVRAAYRTLHCGACAPGWASLLSSARGNYADGPQDDQSLCGSCGTDTGGMWCVTYATLFVPHADRADLEMWNCEPCALKLRAKVIDIGVRLPDREPLRAPAAAAVSPWAKVLLE